ncbi:MAG: AAA family ATPase [Candidatus Paceibacterota bacterium]
MSDDSFLDSLQVASEPIKRPFLGVIYGEGGTGKTGACMYAPDPFYVSVEAGTDWIPAPKFVDANGRSIIAQTSEQLFQMIGWLCKKANIEKIDKPVKTVIIDSLGFAERLFYNDIVLNHPFTDAKEPKPVKTIIDLGYDGQGFAMDYWHRLLTGCEQLRKRGFNVILITHAAWANENSEGGKTYKKKEMALQVYGRHNVPELLKRSSDFVYFMSSEIMTSTVGAGKWTKNLGTNSEAETVIHTRPTSLFYAKTRSIDGSNIPDAYSFTVETRKEVCTQMFNDIINN